MQYGTNAVVFASKAHESQSTITLWKCYLIGQAQFNVTHENDLVCLSIVMNEKSSQRSRPIF